MYIIYTYMYVYSIHIYIYYIYIYIYIIDIIYNISYFRMLALYPDACSDLDVGHPLKSVDPRMNQ